MSLQKKTTQPFQQCIGHLKKSSQYSLLAYVFPDSTHFEIRMEPVSTRRTNHYNATNIFWKSQFLPTLRTFFFNIIGHGFLYKASVPFTFALYTWFESIFFHPVQHVPHHEYRSHTPENCFRNPAEPSNNQISVQLCRS